jgi:hypothetical protein
VRKDEVHSPKAGEPFDTGKVKGSQDRKGTNWASWLEYLSAAKVLSLSTLVIAIGLFIPFLADLLTGWPFHRASVLMDSAFSACTLMLGFLTLHTMREID